MRSWCSICRVRAREVDGNRRWECCMSSASRVYPCALLFNLTLPASSAVVRQCLLCILTIVLSIYVGQLTLSWRFLLNNSILLAGKWCLLSSSRFVLLQLNGRGYRSQLLQEDIVFASPWPSLVLESLFSVWINLLSPLWDNQIVAHPC